MAAESSSVAAEEVVPDTAAMPEAHPVDSGPSATAGAEALVEKTAEEVPAIATVAETEAATAMVAEAEAAIATVAEAEASVTGAAMDVEAAPAPEASPPPATVDVEVVGDDGAAQQAVLGAPKDISGGHPIPMEVDTHPPPTETAPSVEVVASGARAEGAPIAERSEPANLQLVVWRLGMSPRGGTRASASTEHRLTDLSEQGLDGTEKCDGTALAALLKAQ